MKKKLSNFIDISVMSAKGAPHQLRLKRQASKFLKILDLRGVELSILVVSDARIRTLNRTWRKKDKATDVLSFPAGEQSIVGLPKPLGDIVISIDTTLRASKHLGRTPQQELDRYLAHGLLHLLGFDHQTPKEARQMSREEDRLLGTDGMLSGSDELEP